MYVEATFRDSILVVKPHEDIIRENVDDIENAILKHISKSVTDVIIDFALVQYVNSYSLGTLVKIKQKLEEQSINLHFINVAASIKTLFKITRVLDYFSLLNSIDDIKR